MTQNNNMASRRNAKLAPHALKGQKLLAQGNTLGIHRNQQCAL